MLQQYAEGTMAKENSVVTDEDGVEISEGPKEGSFTLRIDGPHGIIYAITLSRERLQQLVTVAERHLKKTI